MSANATGGSSHTKAEDGASRSHREVGPHDALAFVLQLSSTAPTLEQTLRAVCAASPLWSRAPYFLHFEGDLAFVRTALPPDEDESRSLELWLRLLRCAVGSAVAPSALYIMGPALGALAAPRTCPVHAAHPWFGLAFGRADLVRPNPEADARLYQMLNDYTEARLCVLGPVQATSQALHQALRTLGDLSHASAPLLADSLGFGVRTLHRELRAEGSSYRRVLEQLRMQRCLARIRSGDVKTSELSRALGFVDEASFHRAFKRWTGLTVPAYLLRHVAGGMEGAARELAQAGR